MQYAEAGTKSSIDSNSVNLVSGQEASHRCRHSSRSTTVFTILVHSRHHCSRKVHHQRSLQASAYPSLPGNHRENPQHNPLHPCHQHVPQPCGHPAPAVRNRLRTPEAPLAPNQPKPIIPHGPVAAHRAAREHSARTRDSASRIQGAVWFAESLSLFTQSRLGSPPLGQGRKPKKSIAHAVPFPKPDINEKLTANSIAHPVQAPKSDRTGALQQEKEKSCTGTGRLQSVPIPVEAEVRSSR